MKKEWPVEEALQYLLYRDHELANYISKAAGVSMKFSENLVHRLAETLDAELKKTIVEAVKRESHLRDLIKLQQRMLQRFSNNLSDLEDHVSQLRDRDQWNKICDELNRPDLKSVYV